MTVVAVLAGGLGTRLGGAKPSVPLLGRPLISYPVSAALATGLPTVVVSKPSTQLPHLDSHAAVLIEDASCQHPLQGLITALQQHPRVLAVACDMPFLTPELLSWLAARRDAPAAFELDGALAPFPSLHVSDELPTLSSSLREQSSLRHAFEAAGIHRHSTGSLARFGEPRRLLTSINTPDQLSAAATSASTAGES
jgi:molybdenum cofactor guanylyltransferase